ncbi:MAG TPA: ATP-binding protein [Thermoleophilaceae bacterium]|nr:ATP-binding protein [Thermoleophilaceae bacterium]
MEISPDPAELARMREFVRFSADRWGLEESECFRAQLVATEAVTNAIRHGAQSERGESPIVVTCGWDGNGFTIEVGDRGRFRHRKPSRADDTGGRGLGLIERFTNRFDLETGDEGTRLRMLVGAA